jgi:hypothetical protein
MIPGTRVRLKSLVSYRGTHVDSLMDEYINGTEGIVKTHPDAIGWVHIQFPGIEAQLQAPIECLEVITRRRR